MRMTQGNRKMESHPHGDKSLRKERRKIFKRKSIPNKLLGLWKIVQVADQGRMEVGLSLFPTADTTNK